MKLNKSIFVVLAFAMTCLAATAQGPSLDINSVDLIGNDANIDLSWDSDESPSDIADLTFDVVLKDSVGKVKGRAVGVHPPAGSSDHKDRKEVLFAFEDSDGNPVAAVPGDIVSVTAKWEKTGGGSIVQGPVDKTIP